MSEENKEWEIVQTIDTVTPGNVHFSEKSLRAKLMNQDGVVSSQLPSDDASLAHANSSMTCYACHTSWTPTCFGCHLQMTANARKPMLLLACAREARSEEHTSELQSPDHL